MATTTPLFTTIAQLEAHLNKEIHALERFLDLPYPALGPVAKDDLDYINATPDSREVRPRIEHLVDRVLGLLEKAEAEARASKFRPDGTPIPKKG